MKFTFQDKKKSREETIILPYKKSFGKSNIQENKQYWTLCAECINKETKTILEESELHQILSSGFIQSPENFHGVDTNEEIIKENKKLNIGNFYHGDFYGVMSRTKNYNPAVVNLDLLRTFQTEKENIKKIFKLLSPYKEVLFNVNVLFENHNVKYREPEEIMDFLKNDIDIKNGFLKHGWRNDVNIYPYKGLGKVTRMVSVTLFKK
jgi:hypothetical protein